MDRLVQGTSGGSRNLCPSRVQAEPNPCWIEQRELDAVMADVNSAAQHTLAGLPSPSLVHQCKPTVEHPQTMSNNMLTITSKPLMKQAHAAGTSPFKSSKGKGPAINPPSPTAGPSHHFHQVPDSSAVPL
jgi:hypothetical protein